MFARTNIVQNNFAKAVQEGEKKTDEQLLAELEAESATVETFDLEYLKYSGIKRYYFLFCSCCIYLTQGEMEQYFNCLMILVITLAALLVGLQTYPSLESNPILEGFQNLVLAFFVLECVLKIFAEKSQPWKYFVGHSGAWNTFDFLVVIVCMPFITRLFKGNGTSAIRVVSRLFRLVRIMKIVNQVPALQVILDGLVGGMKSVTFIGLLLLLFIYVYAIIGVYIFSDNDPFFFRNVLVAMMTLMHACTLEGWTDNMMINIYGCRHYDAGLYTYTGSVTNDDFPDLHHFYRCKTPTPNPVFTPIFWLSFTIFASFVLLSLFVGVITMNMQAALEHMRNEVEEYNRKKALKKQTEEMKELHARSTEMDIVHDMQRMRKERGKVRGHSTSDVAATEVHSNTNSKSSINSTQILSSIKVLPVSNSEGGSIESQMLQHQSRRSSFTDLILGVDDGDDDTSFSESFSMNGINDTSALIAKMQKYLRRWFKSRASVGDRKKMRDMAEMRSLLMQAWHGTSAADEYQEELDFHQGAIFKLIRRVSVMCRVLIERPYFNNAMTLIIVLTGVLVGVEANAIHDVTPDPIFNVLDNVVWSIFLVEVILRLTAEEFHLREYFRSRWNMFDFLIVIASKLNIGNGSVVYVLRILRLMRVLKLLKSFPELAVIVNSVIMSMSSIGYILLVMLLTYYVLAILANLLFSDNDPFNFGNLHLSMLALFRIATLDNWGAVMYKNYYGCDIFPPPTWGEIEWISNMCVNPTPRGPLSTLYFVLFLIVGSFVMLTLFIGVVTTSMEEASKQQVVEKELEKRISELCNEHMISHEQLDIYRRVFSILDLDGGGSIEPAELKLGLSCVNIYPTDAELESWIREVDINFDGVVDMVEFVTFMTNMRKRNAEMRRLKLQEEAAKKLVEKFRLRREAKKKEAEEKKIALAKEKEEKEQKGESDSSKKFGFRDSFKGGIRLSSSSLVRRTNSFIRGGGEGGVVSTLTKRISMVIGIKRKDDSLDDDSSDDDEPVVPSAAPVRLASRPQAMNPQRNLQETSPSSPARANNSSSQKAAQSANQSEDVTKESNAPSKVTEEKNAQVENAENVSDKILKPRVFENNGNDSDEEHGSNQSPCDPVTLSLEAKLENVIMTKPFCSTSVPETKSQNDGNDRETTDPLVTSTITLTDFGLVRTKVVDKKVMEELDSKRRGRSVFQKSSSLELIRKKPGL